MRPRGEANALRLAGNRRSPSPCAHTYGKAAIDDRPPNVSWGLIGVVVGALALFVAALALQARLWPGEVAEGHVVPAPPPRALGGYWGAFALSWLALSALAAGLWRHRVAREREADDGRPAALADAAGGWGVASRRGFVSGAVVVLMVAAMVRVAVVLLSAPVLSDDIWRYVHDGATLRQGENPYAIAPAELSPSEAPVPGVHPRINHPELVTIYQPVGQYAFALFDAAHARLPAGLRERDAGRDRTYRLGLVALELALVGLLLAQLYRERRSPWWACLYAWHPLAISEVAGSGHQDVIGIALLIAALAACDALRRGADGPARWKRDAWGALGGAALAAAGAVKPIVWPLALLLAWRARGMGARPLVLGTLAAAGTTLALYLPFLVMDGGLARMIETGRTFTADWSFNASLHALAWWALGEKTWADGLMGLLLAGVLVVCMGRGWDVWRGAGIYLLAMVLVSSTVHPWYVLWALALVAVRFELTTWVLSLMVMLAYEAFLRPATFEVGAWVVWAQYVPVYAVLVGRLAWMYYVRGRGERVMA